METHTLEAAEAQKPELTIDLSDRPSWQAKIASLKRFLPPGSVFEGDAAVSLQVMARRPEDKDYWLDVSGQNFGAPFDVGMDPIQYAKLEQDIPMWDMKGELPVVNGYFRLGSRYNDVQHFGGEASVDLSVHSKKPSNYNSIEVDGEVLQVADPEELLLVKAMYLGGYANYEENSRDSQQDMDRHAYAILRGMVDENQIQQQFSSFKEQMQAQHGITIQEERWQELDARIQQSLEEYGLSLEQFESYRDSNAVPKTRAHILRSILTQGLKSSRRMYEEGEAYFGSHDILPNEDVYSRIISRAFKRSIDDQLYDALYASSNSVLPVMGERPWDGLNVFFSLTSQKPNSPSDDFSAVTQRKFEDRVKSSFLVVLNGREIPPGEHREVIDPGDIIAVLVPENIANEYLEGNYSQSSIPIRKVPYVKKTLGSQRYNDESITIEVPDFESTIRQMLTTREDVDVTGVRLPKDARDIEFLETWHLKRAEIESKLLF